MTKRKSTAKRIPIRHHLYRHWDVDGNLLYVGISVDAIKRLQQHYDTADWYDEVASITIQKFDDRGDLERAEQLAIDQEAPIWNRTGKHKAKKARPKMTSGAHEVMTLFRDNDFQDFNVKALRLLLGSSSYSFDDWDATLLRMENLGYVSFRVNNGLKFASLTDLGFDVSEYWYTQGKQPCYPEAEYQMTCSEDGLMGAQYRDNSHDIRESVLLNEDPPRYEKWWINNDMLTLTIGTYAMNIFSPKYQKDYGCGSIGDDEQPLALAHVKGASPSSTWANLLD